MSRLYILLVPPIWTVFTHSLSMWLSLEVSRRYSGEFVIRVIIVMYALRTFFFWGFIISHVTCRRYVPMTDKGIGMTFWSSKFPVNHLISSFRRSLLLINRGLSRNDRSNWLHSIIILDFTSRINFHST